MCNKIYKIYNANYNFSNNSISYYEVNYNKKNSLDDFEVYVINVYKSTSYDNESQSFESANTDSKFNAISIFV